MWRLSVLCVLCNILGAICIFTPVLRLPQGKLRGLRSPLKGQHNYFGVPYAVAERFQVPKPAPKWRGTFNAVNPLTVCPQAPAIFVLGKEDCLHLDIHTPGVPSKPKLPVMVFLHGGAYYHGGKYQYDPESLVDHDTIVIVLNYRLGVFGFLCLDKISNLGLRDQVAALKWIQKNIEYFGGDPNNVTLFGQSAGASAAGMHLISSASKGLFHKAILQSGSPLAPWAFNVEPEVPIAVDAKKLNAMADSSAMTTFTNASLYDLLVATKGTSINTRHFKYSPCVDGDFIDDAPYNILASGNYTQVPLIVGTTQIEGLLFYGLHDPKTLREFDENFFDKLPSVFRWCSEEERRIISGKLRSYYFGTKPINAEAIERMTTYYSDWIVHSSNSAFTDIIASTSSSPVYSYVFSYDGDRNYGKFLFGSAGLRMKGATHSDDIFYLFKILGIPLISNTADTLVVDRMTTMWTNFAKTGNPTPSVSKLLPVPWLPINQNNRKVLKIDRTLRMVSQKNYGKFFFDLLCEHGLAGYVPCESKQNCKRV